MVKIHKTLKKKYFTIDQPTEIKRNQRGAHLVMQLHDELIYEVNEKDLDDVKAIVKEAMENSVDFLVKMKVKMRVGKKWGDLTNIHC